MHTLLCLAGNPKLLQTWVFSKRMARRKAALCIKSDALVGGTLSLEPLSDVVGPK